MKIKKFASRTVKHIFGMDDLTRCVCCARKD